MDKRHYERADPDDYRYPFACGVFSPQPGYLRSTKDERDVTCKNCLRTIRRHARFAKVASR